MKENSQQTQTEKVALVSMRASVYDRLQKLKIKSGLNSIDGVIENLLTEYEDLRDNE